jgi:hypothetical protein
MAGSNYGGDGFWNISIHYIGEASKEHVVLWTEGGRDQGIVHSRLNRVSFTNLTIDNGSVAVQSCNGALFEGVTLSGTSPEIRSNSICNQLYLSIGSIIIALKGTNGSFRNMLSSGTESFLSTSLIS